MSTSSIGYMTTTPEDHSKVRVELAAVVAQALSASGPSFFSADLGEQDLAAYLRFLRNRQLTEMLSFFQTVRPVFPSRTAFYAYATDPRHASAFRAAAMGVR
jgi:hypothetical protein